MKITLYSLIILLTFSITNRATADDKPLQGLAKIDSLLDEVLNAKGDTNEVNLWAKLSFSMSNLDSDKGIEYGLNGLELAKQLRWKLGEANCYNALGVNYKVNSNYPKALEYYHKSLIINEGLGDKMKIAYNLGNIGNVYTSQSNYTKALEYHKKALKINQEMDRKTGIATNLVNIGNLYSMQTKNSEALEYFHKALAIYEELGKSSGINVILGNLGSIYFNEGNYPEAEEYFLRGRRLNEKTGNKKGMAYKLSNLGVLYLVLAQDTIGLNNSRESRFNSLNKEINLNKSEQYLLRAKVIFEELNNLNELSQTYSSLHQVYRERGLFKKAYFILEKQKILQDSIFSQENNIKLTELERAREEDIKQKEIEKQSIRITEQQKREKLILYFSLAIVFLLILILVIIFRQRRKADKLLYNVLPVSIAKRLKKKEHPISDYFTQASIVFIDIVNFTELAKDADPRRVVEALNKIFTKYDAIANKYGLEKIKTIGDSYMAAAGIPEVQKDNTHRAAQMALEVKAMMSDYRTADGTKIEVRIGLDCGPVVAGVIGENKFIYDMWSDAVNTASRMESSSIAGEVQVSERFKEAVSEYEEFTYVERGEIEIKGKGKMKTFFIS